MLEDALGDERVLARVRLARLLDGGGARRAAPLARAVRVVLVEAFALPQPPAVGLVEPQRSIEGLVQLLVREALPATRPERERRSLPELSQQVCRLLRVNERHLEVFAEGGVLERDPV